MVDPLHDPLAVFAEQAALAAELLETNRLVPIHYDGYETPAKRAVVSAAPVGPPGGQASLERWILMSVLDRLFAATYHDRRRMETILHDSSADWIVLRPPRLVQKEATGAYRLDSRPLPKARAIAYRDLTQALLDVIENPQHRKQAVYVAN